MSDDLNKGGGFEEFKPSSDQYNAEQDSLNDSLIPKEDYSSQSDQVMPTQEPTAASGYTEAATYRSFSASNDMLTGDTKLFSALCHLSNVVGWFLLITLLWPPILFFFIKSEDEVIKFHAKQATIVCLSALALSLVLGVLMTILTFVTAGCATCIIVPVLLVLGLGAWGYLVYVTVKVFQGHNFRIPVISDWADKIDI